MRRGLLVAVLALLIAACGGSDEPTTTTGGSSDAAASAGASEAAGGDTAASEAGTEAAGSEAAAGGGGELTQADCQQALAALQALPTAIAGATTGGADTAAIAAQAEAFLAVADKAPAEIADDMRTIGGVFQDVATTLEGVDLQSGQVPPPEALQQLTELSTRLSSAEITEASTNISTFFSTNCTG